MRVELDKNIESAILRTLPDGDIQGQSLFGSLIERVVQNRITPRSTYTYEMLHAVGSTIGDMLVDHHDDMTEYLRIVPEAEPIGFHPKDRVVIWDYVRDALRGVDRIIGGLAIPSEAKRYLSGVMDHMEVDIHHTNGNRSETYIDAEGRVHASLDIPAMFNQMRYIRWIFREGGGFNSIFRGIVLYTVAHETGHGIHQSFQNRKKLDPTDWYAQALHQDYPLQFTAEQRREKETVMYFQRAISHERFAHFFGMELLQGLGMRSTFIVDFFRSSYFSVFGTGFSYDQMNAILEGVLGSLFDPKYDNLPEEDDYRMHLTNRLLQELITHAVFFQYPYSRQVVESLITSGWNGKKREFSRE